MLGGRGLCLRPKGFFNTTRSTAYNEKFLDTLNASQVAALKIREFRSYVKHTFSSYMANRTLSNLLEDSVNFSQELFNSIFTGLQAVNAKDITVKGYDGMRKFIYKI